MWNWDDKCSRSYSITHETLAAILSNRWPAFSILVSLPTNKQTNKRIYELKNIYTQSRWIFWLIIRCKLQNISRFINVNAGRPILPGIGTNSLGWKFRTGTNCLRNFGRPEHLAAGPSSLIHRVSSEQWILRQVLKFKLVRLCSCLQKLSLFGNHCIFRTGLVADGIRLTKHQGLTKSGLEPTSYCTWGKHVNHYTSDAVWLW